MIVNAFKQVWDRRHREVFFTNVVQVIPALHNDDNKPDSRVRATTVSVKLLRPTLLKAAS